MKNNIKNEDILSPEEIRKIASGFQASRILLSAYELGIFTVISGEGKTSAETALELGTDERATDRLLNALCALKFVNKKNGRFLNTESSATYLVKGRAEYMSGLMHTAHLWNTWCNLTEAVRTGTSPRKSHVNDRGENWLEAFIAAMHYRAEKQAPADVAMIDLSGVSHVLDLGGGSGVYAMAFAEAGDCIKSTVFDLPNVAPITRRYIETRGLSDRVKVTEGDYLINDLGKGYDIVFLSAIIHSNSFRENRGLIKKCAEALNAGGKVIVQDFIMDEDRTSPAHGALFALNMLVGTPAGDTFTEKEVSGWMKDAGLTVLERKDTGRGTTQITGKK